MPHYIEIYQDRPTRAEVSLSNLKNNFEIAKSLVKPGTQLMGVVKANAYGHGLYEISCALLSYGASCLGVAYLEEAVYLRKTGITAPVVVLGAINVDQIPDFIEHDIEITSSSIDKSRAISETAVRMNKKAVVHLKIDTGMERIGVHWYNAEKFINESCALPNITIKGIFSHFAKADSDSEFTKEQIGRFETALSVLSKQNALPPCIHIASSEGLIRFPEAHYTLVRPGIMLYGYAAQKNFNGRRLCPVMTLKTKVSFFKVVKADTGISYSHTYRTKHQTRIITLPVGYGDGYNRLLSNKGEVIIRGNKYTVSGNVCMDQMMVDIGTAGTAYNGDDVLLFGESGDDAVDLEKLCAMTGTIPYEFLCMISSRVPRVYFP
jgi:alanine racemase